MEELVELPDVKIVVIGNVRPIRIATAIIVITQHAESCSHQRFKGRVPDVIRHAESGRKNNHTAVPRATQLVMRVSVADRSKLSRNGLSNRRINLELLA